MGRVWYKLSFRVKALNLVFMPGIRRDRVQREL